MYSEARVICSNDVQDESKPMICRHLADRSNLGDIVRLQGKDKCGFLNELQPFLKSVE